jgi:hypothetical protein
LKDVIRRRPDARIIGMMNHDGGFGLLSLGVSFAEACQQLVDVNARLTHWLGRSGTA